MILNASKDSQKKVNVVNVSEQPSATQLDVKSNGEAGFPGHILRNAREAMGLSQQELARQLRLTSRVLEAIEAANFSIIPSPIFARGYIRNYARYVSADSDMLISAFDRVYGRPDHIAKPMTTIKDVKKQANSNDTWVKVSTGLFLVIVVGLTLLWWQGQHETLVQPQISKVIINDEQGDAVVASTEPTTVTETINQDLELGQSDIAEKQPLSVILDESDATKSNLPVDIQPLVNQLNDPTVVLNKISIPASNEPDKSVTNAEVITDASISVSPVAVSEFDADTTVTTVDKGQLVMLFNDDCWVEVKDGNDNTVITNLLRKDQRIDVFIQVPVQVLLGRASSLTTITFNGMDVDLAPHIRKDIARVTLGQ